MSLHILTFDIPAPLRVLLTRRHVETVSRGTLQGDYRQLYHGHGQQIWLAALNMVLALLDGIDDQGRCLTGRVCKIGSDRMALRLRQQVNVGWAEGLAFALTLAKLVPGSRVVADLPADLVDRLIEAGAPLDRRLSRLAWQWSALCLRLTAVARHLSNFAKLCRDRRHPSQVVAGDAELVLFPQTKYWAVPSNPERQSLIDFVDQSLIPPVAGNCLVVAEGKPENSAGKVQFVPDLLGVRRAGGVKRSLWPIVAKHLLLLGSSLFGNWRDVILAADAALVPRAIAMLDSLKPQCIIGSVAMLRSPNLWHDIAHARGVQLYGALNSTQVRPPQFGDRLVDFRWPFYMVHVFDRYAAWSEEHAQMMNAIGIDSANIDVVGPLMFSARPERVRLSRLPGEPVVVDYFDQMPINENTLFVPCLYHTVERACRTLYELYAALTAAFPDGGFILRIKSKKLTDGVPWEYVRTLDEFTRLHPNVRLESVWSNPFFLSSTADATVGFPYVSPAVASKWYGVPTCFFDIDGHLIVEPLAAEYIPVVSGRHQLAEWFRQVVAPASET